MKNTNTENIKKAILTMGLPGAGKSYILKKEININEYILIDPDEIKKEHPDYNPKDPQITHEWSKRIADLRTLEAIANNQNIIIDGTGTNVEKMYKKVSELKANGYEVTLLYVKVRLETAIKRNANRERVVPQEVILEKYDTITYAYEILSGIASKVKVVNND